MFPYIWKAFAKQFKTITPSQNSNGKQWLTNQGASKSETAHNSFTSSNIWKGVSWIALGISIPIVGYGLQKNSYFVSSKAFAESFVVPPDPPPQPYVKEPYNWPRAPLRAMHLHLSGFDFYNGNMERQVESHRFCTALSKDFAQCLIFDGDDANAKLIGAEYIISEKVFKEEVPKREQRYWHSNAYAVKSGLTVTPELPIHDELGIMEGLATTYARTIYTWQVDKDRLPVGPPQLMMSFVADNQVEPSMVKMRNLKYGISAAEILQERSDIVVSETNPNADTWTKGLTMQFVEKRITDYKFWIDTY